MKYLLFSAILGYSCWIGSEVVELAEGGYNSTVYYLTAAFHFFAGFGIWGLHFLQKRSKNILSLTGTVMISLSYLALVYLPIQVLHSGLSNLEFVEIYPFYKIPAFFNLAGLIIFGIAVIKAKLFPVWTGVVIIFGSMIFVAAMTNGFPLIANVNNIILSTTIIYMCILGYQRLKSQHALTV
ncbi:hypothetical protein SAMN00777080_2657 [Aquiflexum balticum DSM 16537]|jgi:hypothetical protein|uniref:Uncharacterized protein n=1 Tax=Aquiflexum balticum DSM 16537 TaxID=758820 RepID=A0A1W2H5X7_9BACT|nr:hypothetical protein [Aquiflexum balticum]SMD44042.1 hypothetical protein SAMN00777080_2657 [Aquiflexum balticum DSM 16537]